MTNVCLELCIILCAVCVSRTEFVKSYVGCERELPALNEESPIFGGIRIFWGRQDLGGIILVFDILTGTTTYANKDHERKYVVNNATFGLIIKDVSVGDTDIYTRIIEGLPDLQVNFTVLQQAISADDLNNVLLIMYDGEQVTADRATLTITRGDSKHLIASAADIEYAGDPELVWVDAVSGTYRGQYGDVAELELEPGVFFVRSRLCNTMADSFSVTIVDKEHPTTEQVCSSLKVESVPGETEVTVELTRYDLTSPGYTDTLANVTDSHTNGTVLRCVGRSQTCIFSINYTDLIDETTNGVVAFDVKTEAYGYEFSCTVTFGIKAEVSGGCITGYVWPLIATFALLLTSLYMTD